MMDGMALAEAVNWLISQDAEIRTEQVIEDRPIRGLNISVIRDGKKVGCARAISEHEVTNRVGHFHLIIAVKEIRKAIEQQAAPDFSEPEPRCPLACDRPWDQQQGRFCPECQKPRATCANDHCLDCGSAT